MIQRIQTLFLFFSAIALLSLFFAPLVSYMVGSNEVALFIDSLRYTGGGEVVFPTWPLGFLLVVMVLINLITIFLFKKRNIQMRLTIYNMILMLGFLVLTYYYAVQGEDELSQKMQIGFYSVMPLVSMILSFLAYRGIRKDDLMLKAIDRIR